MKKFKSAKEKQAYLEYQEWLAKHNTVKKTHSKPEPLKYSLSSGTRDTNPNNLVIKSHGVVMSSDATVKKKEHKYTGDAIVGVATMHKSNLTPVFSKEDAVSISSMRR